MTNVDLKRKFQELVDWMSSMLNTKYVIHNNLCKCPSIHDEEVDRSLLWIDPFANTSRIAKITNDLNPEFDTDYHMDALDFLKMFDDNSVDGVLYDPPYSPRQVAECYHGVGYNVTSETTRTSFWSAQKKTDVADSKARWQSNLFRME